MIQPKELRIGNWVLHKITPGQVHRISPSEIVLDLAESVEFKIFPLDDITPIRLTPAIFRDCGFQKDDLENKWFNSSIGYVEEYEDGYTLPDLDGEPSILYVLQHLHQLQNLYFALTQIELNYQP